MNPITRFHRDDVSRRRFLSGAAKSFLGVGMLGSSPAFAAATKGASIAPRKNPAKRVIYLYMSGGMSHLDTFNPRPDAPEEIRGETEVIKTNADGVRLSGYLPQLANHMDKAVVFNSLKSTQGAHEQGRYYMRTNYVKRGTIQHPHLGAWSLKFLGKMNEELPGFVSVAGGSREVGAGFFESSYEPLAVRDAKSGLKNSALARGVSQELFDRRMNLSERLNYDFRNRYDDRNVKAYTAMYEDAVKLMKSSDLDAFDITKEDAATRDSYGDHAFGQGCLLARRLSEQGVRFVEVQLGGWDTHTDNFQRVAEQASILDQAMAALLADLSGRGMLEDTMVVLATEFGRTPKINQNVGRDHYPKAFSAVIAGGGIHGGQVYGTTSVDGTEVEENPLDIMDFNATVAYGMGLPLNEVLYSPSRRPFNVANKGTAAHGLFRA